MKIKALIVDDEAPARSEIRYLTEKIKDIEVLGEATTAKEALQLLEAVDYDIVFLDIDMPGMSGMEMAEKVKELNNQPQIIFTTAYGQFAVKAFELDIVDYLVKPVSEERLEEAVSRVREKLNQKNGVRSSHDEKPPLDRIPVTKDSKTILLQPTEIYFIKSHGEFTVISSEKGKYVSSFRLKEFEARLPKKIFFRSHRSYVVNLDHVEEMVSLYGGLYMLKLNDEDFSEVPVSRRQTRELKTLLGLR